MLAIMGASGSGKTSLLNILGERLDVSSGCKVQKEIRANNIPVLKGDFGKLGAFVMQDDILIETMTPFESFCFAARLRTNLSEKQVRIKANNMIDRL
jgi:ABC-type multidrug transport system ATPase subunit